MSIGMEGGESPTEAGAGRATKCTPSSLHVWLFTYRRSCFRPLCLPWCHPAASGGRSRVCSTAVWRCPSAGALQSKHRVKDTLAPRIQRAGHTLKMHVYAPISEHAHWLNKRRILIFTLWNSQIVKRVCEKVAFSRIDGTLVSAKRGIFQG